MSVSISFNVVISVRWSPPPDLQNLAPYEPSEVLETWRFLQHDNPEDEQWKSALGVSEETGFG